MRFFLLLFITIPIVEMWVLIEVGSEIGALSTIFLVFLTAAIGLALLRQQGVNTLLRVNQRMEQGQLPAGEILEGVMLAVGGALLLTPGFITDAIGFACLLPFSRQLLVALLLRQGVVMASYGRNANFDASFRSSETLRASRARPGEQSGSVIEGEYERED
ncbi:FxsA family protein [Oceanicoccus sagamiensis]|uniref:Biotin--acetyl-CoA-carboxylase ligase n=1 Tax=Oceanicoccus sagamiensis TaxID=716816 RepID=A0A1X9N6I3_9GAMM|nr:FxsA family protein [Oceanicoccus sagamiensis]ARN72861.1 biotin--acetyl-CoA-carboxylase ligase [Oceanicoccus sagamiensis]